MSNFVSNDVANAVEPKPGLFNRVFNQTIDSKSVKNAISAVGGIALATAAYAFSMPIHVAVMGQGTARSDYGFSNIIVNARADSSNDFRGVHATPEAPQSRGAVATAAMLHEMRLHSSNPIVVHAYDPFVKDGSGKQKLNLKGIAEIAPVLAKAGVKVTVVAFSISNSPDGRKMSQIMKMNGIAVVAPAPEKGTYAAPDILTVQSWDFNGKGRPTAHFQVNEEPVPAIGKLAGTGAIYALVDKKLRGSQAIGFAIQQRFDFAENIVERNIGDGMKQMVDTMGMVPGIRILPPQPRVAHAAQIQSAAMQASGANQGR
jgi:hypothetical protein